jgi:hypothetical protein
MTPNNLDGRGTWTSAQLRFSQSTRLQIPTFLSHTVAVFIASIFRFLLASVDFCCFFSRSIQVKLSRYLGFRLTPRICAAIAGTLLFTAIAFHSDLAHAQLFNQAEQQTTSIFGQYLGNNIIPFMFGLMRVIVWVSAVGFILFAVYQAQRGEQWQPLMQNAFIVIAAVVVVEGLSALFFGGSTGTSTPSPSPN